MMGDRPAQRSQGWKKGRITPKKNLYLPPSTGLVEPTLQQPQGFAAANNQNIFKNLEPSRPPNKFQTVFFSPSKKSGKEFLPSPKLLIVLFLKHFGDTSIEIAEEILNRISS